MRCNMDKGQNSLVSYEARMILQLTLMRPKTMRGFSLHVLPVVPAAAMRQRVRG
jgi:hypothetical protein